MERGKALHFYELVAAFHSAIRAAHRNQMFAVCGKVVRGVMQALVVRRISSDDDSRALVQCNAQNGAELVHTIRAHDAPLAQYV